jgi:hypothetical protein
MNRTMPLFLGDSGRAVDLGDSVVVELQQFILCLNKLYDRAKRVFF